MISDFLQEIVGSYSVCCWSSESGCEGDLRTSLRASWPGLSRLSTWFGASNVRERGKGENFAPAKLCCGPPQVGPVFEALPAWIAGTSPAMTPRAETNSKRYKSQIVVRAVPFRPPIQPLLAVAPAGRSGRAPDATIHARCQFAQNHAEKSRGRRALRRRLEEGLAVGSVRRDWMRVETEAARHRASR